MGQQTIDGVDLLVHQGISQIEIFSGVKADRTTLSQIMRNTAIEILKQSTEG
jgi:shikimate 5-dehydrogenase